MIKTAITRVLSLMVLTTVALTSLFVQSAFAMGSGNPYVDAQTGLDFVVYQAKTPAGFVQSAFQVLPCSNLGTEWIAVTFARGKKRIEIYETSAGVHCSNPGLADQLASVKAKGVIVHSYVFCNPSQASKHVKCSVSDMTKMGGYIVFSLPASKSLKGTDIQVLGTGGVGEQDLVNTANSLTSHLGAPIAQSSTMGNSYFNNCGTAAQKPISITQYCADAGTSVNGIKWSNWSKKSATGVGIYSVNMCNPSCAAGTVISHKVTVKLSQPQVTHGKLYLMKVTILSGDSSALPQSDTKAKPIHSLTWVADFWRE